MVRAGDDGPLGPSIMEASTIGLYNISLLLWKLDSPACCCLDISRGGLSIALLIFKLFTLLSKCCSKSVEGVVQAGLKDGLQAGLAGTDARALVLIVAQANIVLVCLQMAQILTLLFPSCMWYQPVS